MAYNASYTDADIASSVVDTIVKAVLTIGTLIVVIVVTMLYVWIRKKM